MSIYNDPIKYAKLTRIPISYARIWCLNQLEIQTVIDAAKVCPKCGKATLELEGGCYEEGTQDYVYCANDEIPAVDDDGEEYFTECDYTADPEKEHETLSSWYDFDVILALSYGHMNEFKCLMDWFNFVKSEIQNLNVKKSA